MCRLIRYTTATECVRSVRVGEKVPFAKKGRFGVVSGSVEEYFCPFHLNIETSTRDDLLESVIMQKVIGMAWHYWESKCLRFL